MKVEKIDITGEGSQDYAALYTYLLDDSQEIAIKERPIIIICPGGGYEITSDREGEMVALQFAAFGYHAAVLRYSVKPSVYPAAVLELGRAICLLREYAIAWNINANKIMVSGFSAGGHMVANYCAIWNQKWIAEKLSTDNNKLKPNGLILGYPVITAGKYAHQNSFKNLLGKDYDIKKEEMSLERLVNKDMPRTFIWHTYEDVSVPVQNSLLMVNALVSHHIPTEFHMFEKGCHGLSLANELTRSVRGFEIQTACEKWIELVHLWIEGNLETF